MKPWELKHTVCRHHTPFLHVTVRERRGGKAERKNREEGREDEEEAELEGWRRVRIEQWRAEKKMKRETQRVHWQITHVICDSGVIKERLHEEENYLSLCARHWDKETVSNICHTWWWRRIKSHKRCDGNDYLKKQQMDSVTVLILCVNWVMTCCLGQDPVIFYKWR